VIALIPMNRYVQVLHEELLPATGCTEPIAIAYAAAKAREILGCLPERILVEASGNIIKNVKSVVVPNTDGLKGIEAAAVAGVVGGDAGKILEVISEVTDEQKNAMRDYLAAHEVKVLPAEGDVIFDGNVCQVPIISDTYIINVGVYAGDLETTTPAYVPAKKSILCGGGIPDPPKDDVYIQIINKINQIAEKGVTDEQIDEAVRKYLEENPIDTGVQFETDETLKLEDGILSVNTAKVVQEDNTLPVTSAAVYTEVGNINALLATI